LVDNLLVGLSSRVRSASSLTNCLVDCTSEGQDGAHDDEGKSNEEGEDDEENSKPWLLELSGGTSKDGGDDDNNTEGKDALSSSSV